MLRIVVLEDGLGLEELFEVRLAIDDPFVGRIRVDTVQRNQKMVLSRVRQAPEWRQARRLLQLLVALVAPKAGLVEHSLHRLDLLHVVNVFGAYFAHRIAGDILRTWWERKWS